MGSEPAGRLLGLTSDSEHSRSSSLDIQLAKNLLDTFKQVFCQNISQLFRGRHKDGCISAKHRPFPWCNINLPLHALFYHVALLSWLYLIAAFLSQQAFCVRNSSYFRNGFIHKISQMLRKIWSQLLHLILLNTRCLSLNFMIDVNQCAHWMTSKNPCVL